MITRIALGLVAVLLLALGAMNAANKAGLLGAGQPPTRVAANGLALTLAPVWHADTGEFAELRDGVCKLVAPARACAAYFVKGLGSPKAVAAIAVGPAPTGGASLRSALSGEGVEVTGPEAVAGAAGAQRYRSAFKKRGRNASLALTDAIPLAGGNLLLLQVVAEEPEGRYQSQLLADIEKTLEARPQ